MNATDNVNLSNPGKEVINLPARRRSRVRRVNETALRKWALEEAQKTGRPFVWACHGGTVANAYKYPANTEACLVVAFPTGHLWMSVTFIPANKATRAGAAAAHLPAAREVFDKRYGEARREAARTKVVAQVARMIDPDQSGGWGDSPLGG